MSKIVVLKIMTYDEHISGDAVEFVSDPNIPIVK